MKRVRRLLIALTVSIIAVVTAGADTWACWNEEGEFLESVTMNTLGDLVHACSLSPMILGSGVTFNDDGTGYITKGYTMKRHELPFSHERLAEIRWDLDRENALLVVHTELDSGNVNTATFVLVKMLTENVFMIHNVRYPKDKVTIWRLHSPEDIALREYRECMANNKGKGFDAVECGNPLTEFVEAHNKLVEEYNNQKEAG